MKAPTAMAVTMNLLHFFPFCVSVKGNASIHCDASSSLWAPAPQCERVLDFLARNVDSVQCAVKERLTNGLEVRHRNRRLTT